MGGPAWLILPTYNEAENIAEVLRRVRQAAPEAGVLVVDDASPDGTAEFARIEVERPAIMDRVGAF